jgi:hypothetical protein
MATTSEQIDLWRLLASEHPWLELKEAKAQLDNRKKRLHLPETKRAIASQIIAATMEAGLIKADEKVCSSQKYARYLPFWA